MFTSALRAVVALLLVVSCSGPAFSGVEFSDVPDVIPMGDAGASGGEAGGVGGDSLGPKPSAGIDSVPSAGRDATGGQGGGSVQLPSEWLCRFESGLCQCYQDPSQFQEGWLDRTSCPTNERCTVREETACVCWDTEAAYRNALTLPGAKPVEECPS